jgi:hypothetical protein
MGSASAGPLVLVADGIVQLFDPLTFEPIEFKLGGGVVRVPFDLKPGALRVSADGQVIAAGGHLVAREGAEYKSFPSPDKPLPGPDGQTLYTPGRLFTRKGKPLGEQVGGHGKMVWYLPAVQGPLYVSLNQVQGAGFAQSTLSLSVHCASDGNKLGTFPYLDALEGLVDWQSGQTQEFHRHVFLIPVANLLVILPFNKDRLVLHRFDLDGLLAKSDVDYLFVQSHPVTTAVRGQQYSYPLAVRSKKGGVKVKLKSGPEGMSVTPAGRLTWPVPKDFAGKEAEVVLTLSDASGQEVFHSFKLSVRR